MGTKRTGTEDRDQQVLSRLAMIQHKVDSLEQTTAFALRAEAEKHLGTVKSIFQKGNRRAQIYLAANGQRSVQEIAAHLGLKPPNVSRDLSVLAQEGLLELMDGGGNQSIWSKKPIDHTIRIAQFLRSEYGLDKDGKDDKSSKKKRGEKLKKGSRR